MRDILEFSISKVAPEARRNAGIGLRSAVGFVGTVEGADDVFLWRPVHVVAYDQIELAVTIIVHPGGAGGELIDAPQAGFAGHVFESAVVIVVEEMALA